MQLSLIGSPQFSAWGTMHELLKRAVALAEHPEQLDIFNSWVELLSITRPTTGQTLVSMDIFVLETCRSASK